MSEFKEEKSRTSQQLGQIGGVDTVETSFERSLSDFLFLSHSFMMLSFDCYIDMRELIVTTSDRGNLPNTPIQVCNLKTKLDKKSILETAVIAHGRNSL